jgi:hypothetical protein
MKYKGSYIPLGLFVFRVITLVPLAVIYFILGGLDTVLGNSSDGVICNMFSVIWGRFESAVFERRKEETQEMICDTCKHLAVEEKGVFYCGIGNEAAFYSISGDIKCAQYVRVQEEK